MTDLNGKLLGGGKLKATTHEGKVYVEVAGLTNTLANAALPLAMLSKITGDLEAKGQASAFTTLGLKLVEFENYHTAPGLFTEGNEL